MDFKTATDRLTASSTVNLTRVAEEFGITLNSISRMRRGTLRPPHGWEKRLAKLAGDAAQEMTEEAEALRSFARELIERERR